MRTVLVAAVASMAVAGCGKAIAGQPDSRNPAHCVAAINYANYFLREAGHTDMVQQGTARAMFEMLKSRSRGQSKDDAHAAGVALTKAYGKDRTKMEALLVGCLQEEEADPQFRAEYPRLLATVRAHPTLAE